jgi:sodium transport system ATP-binding protein
MELVQVTNLTKLYPDADVGDQPALDNVSFAAKAGEVFGLLGPNGAGKTTALRILATILQPSSGSAKVCHFDVVKQSDYVRHSIGYVSNNTNIYDRMSAWEMVEYFGRLYTIPEDVLQSRITQLFERLQMKSFRDLPGAKMSTGMKQKVSIARALIHDPPVMILDEASLGLDVLAARALQDIVRELRDEGKCIIYSSHIMREIERVCDRVAIMWRGKIIDSGTLDELADRHQERDFEEIFYRLLLNGADQSLSREELLT